MYIFFSKFFFCEALVSWSCEEVLDLNHWKPHDVWTESFSVAFYTAHLSTRPLFSSPKLLKLLIIDTWNARRSEPRSLLKWDKLMKEIKVDSE